MKSETLLVSNFPRFPTEILICAPSSLHLIQALSMTSYDESISLRFLIDLSVSFVAFPFMESCVMLAFTESGWLQENEADSVPPLQWPEIENVLFLGGTKLGPRLISGSTVPSAQAGDEIEVITTNRSNFILLMVHIHMDLLQRPALGQEMSCLGH